MRDIFLLSWRYIVFHKGKTALMVASITLTIGLPIAAHTLVGMMHARLMARARATPLIVGARGSSFDLVLHALYFRGTVPGVLPMAEVHRLSNLGLAAPVPLHVRYTARGFPLVGTDLDYFVQRRLEVRAGCLPIRLGDCVVGARVARRLGLNPGDRLLTDPENVFDIAGSYPLNLRVTGILEKRGSPDDGAVFADLKTAWIVEGLGHGHRDVVKEKIPDVVLKRTEENVVANAALPSYAEVTDANIASFHFHGDPDTYPVTAILAWPHDEKSATILRGRYEGAEDRARILVPVTVVAELMGVVFRIKRFFDAYFGFVLAADLLFLALIILLSLQLRRRERLTMFKLGCSRMTVFWLQAGEIVIVLAVSLVLATGLAGISLLFVPHFFNAFLGL